jgi:hypothetical protein
LFADKRRRKIMTRLNAASKEKARRARAIAIGFDQEAGQQTFRMRKAMLLVAIVMLGTAMASHAFAAGAHMGGGLGLGGGFGGGHMSHGFAPPIIDQTPPMAPTFNPSDSYTVPQSPEAPVSPASPGSVFGNG